MRLNFDSSGKDHCVGVKGMVNIDGKDYISIAGTSMNDKNDKLFNGGNRGQQ